MMPARPSSAVKMRHRINGIPPRRHPLDAVAHASNMDKPAVFTPKSAISLEAIDHRTLDCHLGCSGFPHAPDAEEMATL